jgi:hypothetical protein
MSFFDLYWNVTQDREIGDLRKELEQQDRRKLGSDLNIKELILENSELKVRLAILLRLLISKGVFSAEEYATLIAKARPAPTPLDK